MKPAAGLSTNRVAPVASSYAVFATRPPRDHLATAASGRSWSRRASRHEERGGQGEQRRVEAAEAAVGGEVGVEDEHGEGDGCGAGEDASEGSHRVAAHAEDA